MDIRPTMRVNLMQHAMDTTISSPQISSDGYDVTNLLSNTNKGFLVEHFIKPPIFIEINFVCNIYINEIIMNTRVGTQKSKGIEILINDATVGKCFLTSDQDIVQWVRNVNRDKIKDCTKKDNISKCEFYNGAHKYLNSTKRVTIKIFKTDNSSLVSVKSLKIFGSINRRTNTNDDVHKFIDLLHKTHRVILDKSSDHSSTGISSKTYRLPHNLIIDNANSTSSQDIPEDFLDPITHDFMTNPIILPSGKIIDKSTLDKYLEIELKWNRAPNDPFTHVKFSQQQKPIQALQLKSRIDKFLFLNRHDSLVDKLPRTLKNTNNKIVHENLLFKMTGNIVTSTSSKRKNMNDKNKTENISYSLDRKTKSPELKRRKLCSNLQICNSNHKSDKDNLENYVKEGKETSKECDNIMKANDVNQKFEDVIDLTENVNSYTDANLKEDELNRKIQDALKNLPSFVTERHVVCEKKNCSTVNTNCFNCKNEHLLYKIVQCTHHICRSCLITSKISFCKFCNVSFSSSDVIRIFNS